MKQNRIVITNKEQLEYLSDTYTGKILNIIDEIEYIYIDGICISVKEITIMIL